MGSRLLTTLIGGLPLNIAHKAWSLKMIITLWCTYIIIAAGHQPIEARGTYIIIAAQHQPIEARGQEDFYPTRPRKQAPDKEWYGMVWYSIVSYILFIRACMKSNMSELIGTGVSPLVGVPLGELAGVPTAVLV